MKMKTKTRTLILIVGLLSFALSAGAQYTQSLWLGEIDNDWTNEANWANGVPGTVNGITGAANQAVFNSETDFTTISIPAAVEMLPEAILFGSAMTDSITLQRTGGNIEAPRGFTIEVQAGSAAHTFSVLDGSNRLLGENGQNHYFINDSSSALTLDLQLSGWDGASPRFHYQGSGDTVVTRGANEIGGSHVLHADFTGSVLLPDGGLFNSSGPYRVYGGTLIIDGIARDRTYFFTVDGTLTGHGVLGRSTRSEGNIRDMNYSFHEGSLLVPGRPGETGTLEFENHDIDMQAGSTIRFDLFNPSDHDQLTFRLEYDGTNETGLARTKVPEVYLGGDGIDTGVTLDLNFLAGFSASLWDEFALMSGYDAVHGTFLDLPDKHEWDEVVGGDEYRFRIDYGDSATTLTVIPEPSAAALLLVGIFGVAALRRRTA